MLIDFLTDTIMNMDVFRQDISTVYLYHDTAGKLVATGNHPKRLLFYKISPNTDISGLLEAPAFLGALSYLKNVLSASMMKKEPSVEVVYREKDGKKHCVESLRFKAERFESYFQCTNPAILNDKDRLRQFARPSDSIFFPFTKVMRKEFEEAALCNTPKADTRLFTLSYDGTYVRAGFGAGSHTTSLVLTNEVTGHTEQKFSKQISLDRFRVMIKLGTDNTDTKAGFHPNSFWVDFQTPHALHMIATPTIREQSR